MRTEINQLYQAIGKLLNEDLQTLEKHIGNEEYIKGAMRDSQVEEQVVRAQVQLMENIIKFIELEVTQGDALGDYEAHILNVSKNLIHELKIDHKMEERF